MGTDSRLSVQVTKLTAYAVVTATGSIEPDTHPLLIHHLNQALKMSRVAVIVDMTAVDRCDVTSFTAIVQTFRQALHPAPPMILVDPTERLRRAMAAAALEPVYAHPDLESAVRWLELGTPAQMAEPEPSGPRR